MRDRQVVHDPAGVLEPGHPVPYEWMVYAIRVRRLDGKRLREPARQPVRVPAGAAPDWGGRAHGSFAHGGGDRRRKSVL
jgi:hypothetical protein